MKIKIPLQVRIAKKNNHTKLVNLLKEYSWRINLKITNSLLCLFLLLHFLHFNFHFNVENSISCISKSVVHFIIYQNTSIVYNLMNFQFKITPVIDFNWKTKNYKQQKSTYKLWNSQCSNKLNLSTIMLTIYKS